MLKVVTYLHGTLNSIRASSERERAKILQELLLIRGLIPLLMRPRNGETWTIEERMALTKDLRAISHLSPYLLPAILPGGALFLPMLAWWLDRRRNKRHEITDASDST